MLWRLAAVFAAGLLVGLGLGASLARVGVDETKPLSGHETAQAQPAPVPSKPQAAAPTVPTAMHSASDQPLGDAAAELKHYLNTVQRLEARQ
jgi:hypothetical protein